MINLCPFKDDSFFRIHLLIILFATEDDEDEENVRLIKRLPFFAPRTILESFIILKFTHFTLGEYSNDTSEFNQILRRIVDGEGRAMYGELSSDLKKSEDVQIAILTFEYAFGRALSGHDTLPDWFIKFKAVGMSPHVAILFGCLNSTLIGECEFPDPAMRQVCLTWTSIGHIEEIIRYLPNLTFYEFFLLMVRTDYNILAWYFDQCPHHLYDDDNFRIFILSNIPFDDLDDVVRAFAAIKPLSVPEKVVQDTRFVWMQRATQN